MKTFGANTKKTIGSLRTMSMVMTGVFASAMVVGAVHMVKLAGEAEGVERAFKRLNRPGMLYDLREATKGTASNLELMKAAVRAENFDIPLKNLGSLLKFAQSRARDTGESVEFLTNSIVMGIGRKSPLILDNLGLSVVRVREEFKKTGDMAQAVANIANEELAKVGEVGLTSADQIEKLTAAWSNASIAIGKWLNNSLQLTRVLNNIADFASEDFEWFGGVLPIKKAKAFYSNMEELEKNREKAHLNIWNAQTKKDTEYWTQMLNYGLKLEKLENKPPGGAKDTAYQKWALEKAVALEKAKELTEFEYRYWASQNQQLLQSGAMLDSNINRLETTSTKLKEISAINVTASLSDLGSIGQDISQRYQKIAGMTESLIAAPLSAAFTKGQSVAEAFFDSLTSMLLQFAARTATFGLLSLFMPGDLMGKVFGGFGKFMGFAGGGIIPEPVVGVGVQSGRGYTFAEQGPERVIPTGESGGGLTVNFNDLKVVDHRMVDDYIIPRIQKAMRLGRA